MASSTKKRVLLVDGYIRQHEKLLKLSNIVPKSINAIIFDFQQLIEKWSREWSNSKVNIIDDGSIAEITKDWDGAHPSYITFYGDHIVKYGEKFIWNIEIIKGEDCMLEIGITPNEEEILNKNKSNYNWYMEGGYIWEVKSGYFGYDQEACSYSSRIKCPRKGDKFQMNFDWKQNSLHFSANGEDFGNALKMKNCENLTNDETAEFRLAFSIALGSAKQGTVVIL